MGGDSVVSSHGTHEDSSLEEEEFPFLSSHSLPPLSRENTMNEKNVLDFEEICDESAQPSSAVDFVNSDRKRHSVYQEILQSYDELKIDSKSLKEAKEKILSYKPGTWIEKARGLKLCDYDVPETTCLILVGPKGSGKSSLINRISKVFEDDKFAPARAQVSYNSLIGDGTYFLCEYMFPRDSNSICLYDTRSLPDNSRECDKILKNWMTKGVRNGELVVRSIDSQRLRKSLKHKGDMKGFFSNKSRKVNFVICVINSLLVLNAMENAGALEDKYIETIVSTFNCPFLSFKDDKPVLVFTHGDLLSLSDRARVHAYLGELLGIPPTKQIFDIPDCDNLVTESAVIGMLRYTLEHADRNFPQKSNGMNKVHKISLSLCMILLILAIGFAIGLEQNKFMNQYHAPQQQACYRKVCDTRPKVKGPKVKVPKVKVPKKEPEIEWHKIRHIW
ncbi:uncharacterized protein [Cicer arietinum]|uniref:Uncharacterized protein LOC101507360 isoform X3 n=1 Tax=Cicer arietinum TaxID=3827 RepID=A0A1S2XNY3_CICAR|nr:uncharacterized protein LOC101507360 isoform X3 [Cicer arietinum]